MTEPKDPALASASRTTPEPQALPNVPPTPGQRRMARTFLLALVVILVVTWPFAALKLPEVHAFVPTLAAALFVSDCVTAALLFGQFSLLRQWALLVIANGYLFSAMIAVAHALTFPGAFTPTGVPNPRFYSGPSGRPPPASIMWGKVEIPLFAQPGKGLDHRPDAAVLARRRVRSGTLPGLAG